MSEILLRPLPLTAERFAPYGNVVEAAATAHAPMNEQRFDRYDDLVDVDIEASQHGRVSVSIVRCRRPTQLPYRIEMVERHPLGSQAFIPLQRFVFIVVVEGISGCEQLALSVRRGPLACELQFPYHPHVTVAHHLDDASLDRAFHELADFECVFDVDRFHLYEHDVERGWVPTRDFHLTPPAS